ncbi:MAG: hypothetical protein RRY34_01705 [Victivallaceae bacterium]
MNSTSSTPKTEPVTPNLVQQTAWEKLLVLNKISEPPDSDSTIILFLNEPAIMESNYTWDYLYTSCCNLTFLGITLNRPALLESAISLNKILNSAASGTAKTYYQSQLGYLDNLYQRFEDGFFNDLYLQTQLSATQKTAVINSAYKQISALIVSLSSELKWAELQSSETRLQYIREQVAVMEKAIGESPEELTLARQIWALNCLCSAQVYYENRDTNNYLNLFALFFLNELANSSTESAHCFVAELYRSSAHDTARLRQIDPIIQKMIRSNATYVMDAFVAIAKNP